MVVVAPAPSRILFVMALAEEGVTLPEGSHSLLTGIGKVNAAMKLSQWLTHNQDAVDLVVNLGSAGGVGLAKGTVHLVRRVVQFDMDVSPLGFDKYSTPFDALDQAVAMTLPPALSDMPQADCFTSDRFVAGNDMPPGPCLVEMEAFALAKTCALHSVPFAAVKYVTDQADGEADEDWTAGLDDCGKALSRIALRVVS